MIRHVGLSEVSVEEIEAAREVFQVATVQNLYNLADRAERGRARLLRGATASASSPGSRSPRASWPSRAARWPRSPRPTTPRTGQVALAWLLQRSPVMLPIPGTGSVAHLEENVGGAELELRPTRSPRSTRRLERLRYNRGVADARYSQAAGALADELSASLAAGGRGAGRLSMRVTTLLDRFGVFRLTPTVRAEMAAALDAAGIEVDPSLEHIERAANIRLSRRERPDVPVEDAVHESLWPLGEDAARAVRRIDVDAEGIDPEGLHKHLAEICGPSLSLRTVARILTANPQDAHDYLHEEPDVAFAFRVRPYEPDDDTADDDPMAPKAGVLDFQTVAITAADDWVIIAWHSPTRATGAGEVSADRDWAKSGFEPGVKARWLEGLDDGDDIAMAFMDELLDTVAIARRSMFSWLEAWEIDFSRRLQATETGDAAADPRPGSRAARADDAGRRASRS